MERLDQNYLTNLAEKAKNGSSNAFAELFCAVCDRHMTYLSITSGKENENALKEVYIRILNGISMLNKPALYIPWSCRIIFRYCFENREIDAVQSVDTPFGHASLTQLLNLPVTESQVSLMYYVQHISIREISDILNIRVSAVKACLKASVRHLEKGLRAEEDAIELKTSFISGNHIHNRSIKVSDQQRMKVLEQVYDACEVKPNTVPLEVLSSYAVYRKERFSTQRNILAAAMILFLLLPLFFILPDFNVSQDGTGERGLPVYTIKLNSLLPAGKVTAKMKTHSLPVYEAASRIFTVEPTRNGNMVIEVELINKQSTKNEYRVTDVDNEGPQLTDSRVEGDKVVLTVADYGIGVDYRDVYAIKGDGEKYLPSGYDTSEGTIYFDYPDEECDIYIPDHIGNMLHLSFTFR